MKTWIMRTQMWGVLREAFTRALSNIRQTERLAWPGEKGDTEMLKENKTIETTIETEIALDDCGGHVMLTLRYGGDKFCHALTARDMGKILAICVQYKERVVCCEGDLVVDCVMSDHQVVEFGWIAEGRVCKVVLETTDLFAFEWACRSYCRQLFRTNKGV